jgi:hypothetical protein
MAQSVHLMTGAAPPRCIDDFDYSDGSADFRCGSYHCYVEADAEAFPGHEDVIEGADYYECVRYSGGNMYGTYHVVWHRCVVDSDQRMRVLSDRACRQRAWIFVGPHGRLDTL